MGWAAGMAAGTAMAAQALANRDAKEKKERDASIAKGLTDLDANQALRVKYAAENDPSNISIANTEQSGGLGTNTLAPEANSSPVQSPGAAYTPLEMAEKRRGLYTENNDLEGSRRYEDQVTSLRAVEENTRRFDEAALEQQNQFNQTLSETKALRLSNKQEFDTTTAANKKEFDQTIAVSKKQAEDVGDYYGAQISKLTEQVEVSKTDRALAQATSFGESEYNRIIGTGGSLDQIQTALREKYPEEDGVQLDAALGAATNKYYQDNGLNAQAAGNMIKKAVKPIELFVNQEFENEESMFEVANKTLADVFDPDLNDGLDTKLQTIFDEDNNPKGYAFVQDGQNVSEVFGSVDAIKSYATQEMSNIADDPFFLVEQQQKAKQKAARAIISATSAKAKTTAFNKFLTENPHYLSDGMQAQRMTLKKELGMASELADWGAQSAYVPMDGGGLGPQTSSDQAVLSSRQDRTGRMALMESNQAEADRISDTYSGPDFNAAYAAADAGVRQALDGMTQRGELSIPLDPYNARGLIPAF